MIKDINDSVKWAIEQGYVDVHKLRPSYDALIYSVKGCWGGKDLPQIKRTKT